MFNYLLFVFTLLTVVGITSIPCLLFTKKGFFRVTKFFISYWSIFILISFVVLAVKFYLVNYSSNLIYIQMPDISISTCTLNLKWFLDGQIVINLDINNLFYIITVSLISLFANYHSRVYMLSDQKRERFVLLLNSFALSMVTLVLTKNLVVILLCWELLGITSFFLINHNETQTSSIKAAIKAVTYNRTSDILLLIAVCLYANVTSSMNITQDSLEILQTKDVLFTPFYNIHLLLLCIFLASSIKSVQFFSHMWLPDSMKAPTPASALIHSATLVAAGFYLFLSFKDLFFVFWGTTIFTVIGLLTAIFGAICAAYQDDIKKLLAFSTVANCGFMLTLVSAYDLRLFLLYFTVHGVFKSTCFMFSGNIIIEQNHLQDTRFYKDMTGARFVNMTGIIVSLLGLAAFPFTITYLLKHHYNLTTLGSYTWYCLDVFFAAYSALSMIYALSLIYKLYFLPDVIKTITDKFGPREETANLLTNCVYACFSFAIACTILPAFTYHTLLNASDMGQFVYVYNFFGILGFIFFIGVGMYFKVCAFNPGDWNEIFVFVYGVICGVTFIIFVFALSCVIDLAVWLYKLIKNFFS